MKLLLGAVSYVIALLATLFLGFSYIAYDNGKRGLDTDEQRHVAQAAAFVEQFRTATGQLPDAEAFSTWVQARDAKGDQYDGKGFGYTVFNETDVREIKDCFGTMQAGEYRFSFWNGDEDLHVATKEDGTFAACSDASNFPFAHPLSLCMIFLAIAMVLLGLAMWVYEASEKRSP